MVVGHTVQYIPLHSGITEYPIIHHFKPCRVQEAVLYRRYSGSSKQSVLEIQSALHHVKLLLTISNSRLTPFPCASLDHSLHI